MYLLVCSLPTFPAYILEAIAGHGCSLYIITAVCQFSRNDVCTSRKRGFWVYASCPPCTSELHPDDLLLSDCYKPSPASLSIQSRMTALWLEKQTRSTSGCLLVLPLLGRMLTSPYMLSEALTHLAGNTKALSVLSPCSYFYTADGQNYTRCTAEVSYRLLLAGREHEGTLWGHPVQMPPWGKLRCSCPRLPSLFCRASRGDGQPTKDSVAAFLLLFTWLSFPNSEAEHSFSCTLNQSFPVFGWEITAAEAKNPSNRNAMPENVEACNIYCDVKCCENNKNSCTGIRIGPPHSRSSGATTEEKLINWIPVISIIIYGMIQTTEYTMPPSHSSFKITVFENHNRLKVIPTLCFPGLVPLPLVPK